MRVEFFLRPLAMYFAPSLPRLLLAISRCVRLLFSPRAFPNASTLVAGNFVSLRTSAFRVVVFLTYSDIPSAPEHPMVTPANRDVSGEETCFKRDAVYP